MNKKHRSCPLVVREPVNKRNDPPHKEGEYTVKCRGRETISKEIREGFLGEGVGVMVLRGK